MVFLPHTNTVILLELYCGTITEPGLPVIKPGRFAVISKRNGQQWLLMSEQLLCSCDGFCGASEPEAGAHVTCRLADGYLERIRRLFSNL